MKRALTAMLWLGYMVLGSGLSSSSAGEIDILLQKLVEKGVLTAGEAQQIGTETKEQVKAEIAEGKSATLPAWIQNTKLKGDFRLRYQHNHSKTVADNTEERNRGRIRLRLGLESKVNDKVLVGVGLATGLSDTGGSTVNKDYIRSTNQSFDDSFSKHPINLDYAFAKYFATPWLTFAGGKVLLKDAFYEPGDLMWDTDITPEGVILDVHKRISQAAAFGFKGGLFVYEEESSAEDPWQAHVQPILDLKATDTLSVKTSVAIDYFAVGSSTLKGSSNSNSFVHSGSGSVNVTPSKDILNIMPTIEFTFKEPFKNLGIAFLNVPQVKLFGEYVRNMTDLDKADDDNKSGFMVGFGFGAEKVEKWGDWLVGYNFARLEKNAVLDILPDSDRYEGQTHIRAHELKISYGLGKNNWLDLDIYRAQKLSKPAAPETLVQVDWNMKF